MLNYQNLLAQKLEIGIGSSGFIPTGNFAQKLTTEFSCGLSLNALYQIPKSPFLIGINFEYSIIDQKTLHHLYRVKEYKSHSNAINFNALFRLMSQQGTLRPFFDIQMGLRSVNTKGDFIFDSYFNHSDKHQNVNMNNSTFLGYGLGGGISIYPNHKFGILLGCNYMGSSNLSFVDEKQIDNQSTQGWDQLLEKGFDKYAQTVQANYFNPFIKLNFTINAGPSYGKK